LYLAEVFNDTIWAETLDFADAFEINVWEEKPDRERSIMEGC
jgi:hypothetical protein